MDQYRSRLKLSENFERHWSVLILGEIRMDQSLVHTFSWGNSYGPMILKVLLKFPLALALVHGWLFPVKRETPRNPCWDASLIILYVGLLFLEDEGEEAHQHKECGLSNLYADAPLILSVLILSVFLLAPWSLDL